MIKLRRAMKEDIPNVLSIYGYYVMETAVSFEYETPSLEAFTKRFEDIKNRFPYLVCEVDGVVAGYTYTKNYYEDAAYAWSTEISVYVDEGFQRKGIASFFYRCMEELLKLQGYYTLYAGITGSNDKSVNFHRALGFEKIATYHKVGYKLGAWHDVLWFEKQLQDYTDDPQQPLAFSSLDKAVVNSILQDYTEKMNNKITI